MRTDSEVNLNSIKEMFCIKSSTVPVLDSKSATVVSEHVKLDSSVSSGRGGTHTHTHRDDWNDSGASQEASLRSNAHLITAIISPGSSRALFCWALTIKHSVICLPVLREDVEIKAEGLM